MRLSHSALAILLSTSSCSAFSPTIVSQQRTLSMRPPFMVGSPTPPEPTPREQVPDEDLPSLSDVELPSRRSSREDSDLDDSIFGIFREREDQEALLRSMGVSSIDEIDPWSPDVYIKPRPGKYGWTAIEQTKEYLHKMDSTTVQTLSDNEREENLRMYKQLYEESVMLTKLGDFEGSDEARFESNKRRKADPWFGLNERMEEAVKIDDTEEIQYLKTMLDKVRGPPPSLKDKVNDEGYVPEYHIFGITLSNDRLETLIESVEDEIDRENSRQRSALWELSNIAHKEATKQDREQEIAEAKEAYSQRFWHRVGMVGYRRKPYEEEMQWKKEEMDKERKKLLEKWKDLGVDQEPEDYYSDFPGRKRKLEEKLSSFATEVRRLNAAFEDDEEDEFDEYGMPVSEDIFETTRPMGKADRMRAEAKKAEGNGRPRLPGDEDVSFGELDPDTEINESSSATTGPLTVEVSSTYNYENSDPPMRKHCFQYTVRITNNSPTDTVQLLSRRFEIQTVGSSMKDVVQGEGVTGRQPILKPGEVFEYTSTAPLSVRPIGTTIIAARMSGEYRYCTLQEGQEKATEEQVNSGQGEAGAQLATFHFVFPEDQRVKQFRPYDDDDDDEEEDEDEGVKTTTMTSSSSKTSPPKAAPDATPVAQAISSTATSLPGEPDMTSGNISVTPNDSSDTVTSDVRVVVTSTYRPERSDAKQDKHCFAYNVRISNESKSNRSIQLVSRRFEIQTVGSATKDVVQGPGVTGRQPVLKPGENFEYTSTAPLSVRPMLDKTQVVARMSGEYNFVQLADDGATPLSSTPLKAELGAFHFILPDE
ncbi:hypothetical protein ACHAW6_009761 [Cyclotella cf. meneghiniana]